jgi:hypothetical protein
MAAVMFLAEKKKKNPLLQRKAYEIDLPELRINAKAMKDNEPNPRK